MPHLSLRLFGTFEATLDGEPITTFESVKGQALLAYLALEPERPHSRLKLAGLLWPEQPDATARTNLRNALSSLRLTIGDRGADAASTEDAPVLLITRDTVQFSNASDCWVDIAAFQALLRDGADRGSVTSLEDAVSLYRGDLLEGFYVSESPVFEDWLLVMRDRLERQVAMALQNITAALARRGDHQAARRFAWRWVELEPWQEEAYRRLIQVLAISGRRAEALAQYEACRHALQQEFGVAPSKETTELYEQIRSDSFRPETLAAVAVGARSPYQQLALSSARDRHEFVARDRELTQLDRHLAAALAGRSRAVFVSGEAGVGKTALLQAFARRAQAIEPRLVVLAGSCNAYTGLGDPYLPFREILAQALGGGGPETTQGWSDEDRLVGIMPAAVEAILSHGRDLIDVFLPTASLERCLALAEALHYAWAPALREAIDRTARQPRGHLVQDDLFEQMTAVLQALSQQASLVLVLDDLQWADVGSTSLLFHLGRRFAGSRILILGAYRPEEIALGRDGGRHPLVQVIQEFKRDWGDIEVDLDLADSRALVRGLLEREPHALGTAFGETLLEQTGGHALFTVELLRGMQERGDLIRDTAGRWIEGPLLNWEILPSRVEAVIAGRIDRLPANLRDVLRRASVEGEIFTLRVVAGSHHDDLQAAVNILSGELDRRHHLIRAEGVEKIGDQRLSRYRFRHILFQRYLYSELDDVERIHLHNQVGSALEEIHSVSDDTLASAAPQLAWHFAEAGNLDKAVRYYELAGTRSIQMLAYEEAIGHLDRALALLGKLPTSRARDAREVRLRLEVATPTMRLRSWGAPDLPAHYQRAEALAERLGDPLHQLNVLSLVRMYHTVRADHRRSVEAAERYLTIAQELDDPLHRMVGHVHVAIARVFTGEFAASLSHLSSLLDLYPRVDRTALQTISGAGNPKVGALSICLYSYWYLGYPEQALRAGEEALDVAQSSEDPMSLYLALALKTRLHRWRGEVRAVEALNAPLLRTWTEYHMPMGMANALQDQAWILSEQGRPAEGLPLYQQALKIWEATGMANHLTEFYGVLAEMYAKAGKPEEGLRLIEGAMAIMERTGERYHEAELHRLRGELRLLEDHRATAAAAEDFRRAIEVAQRQSAKMLELRAATSLCRLWQYQGQADALAEARRHMAEVYGWFTEGLDSRDLLEAKALLDGS